MGSNTFIDKKVEQLGKEVGYGHMMYQASKIWGIILREKGLGGGEFVVGPCKAQTVKCECDSPKDCDWCCGCGWITKKVKEVKDIVI